jgi:hypothetical protein
MGPEALARKLDESPARGRELIELHRQTYPVYWQWSDAVEMTAMLFGRLQAAFGWTVNVGKDANPRSLRNFPLQGNGAEMLRLACILATERGIQVCAPIHDALLIEADIDAIADAVAATQAAMREASEIVLASFPLRTDAKIVRYPDRYSDPRGERFWQTVWELIGEVTPITGDTPTPITGDTQPLSPVIPPSSLFLSCLDSSSRKDGPNAGPGPGSLSAATGNDLACEAKTETSELLPSGVPARTNSVAVAGEGNVVAGPRAGCGAGAVARGWDSQGDGCCAPTSPVARKRHQSPSCTARVASFGARRVDNDSPATRSLPGSDDTGPADSDSERQAGLDASGLTEMQAEREAIQWEGCLQHNDTHMAQLVQSLTFP